MNPAQTENLIIEGENLEVLKLLLAPYREQVKCIYIDPPYNVGGDFVYNDNYTEDKRPYWENTGVTENGVKVDTNTDSSGRFHSDWLNMMYSRLLIARDFLTDDGVILISINDQEIHHLIKLGDEVFGQDNFIATLIWEKGRKNDSRFFSLGHEYIVVFAKDQAYLRANNVYWREEKPGAREIYEEYTRLKNEYGDNYDAMETEIKLFYTKLPKNHPSKKLARYSNIDKWGIWRDVDMSLPREGHFYDLPYKDTDLICAMPPDGWRYDYDTMQDKIRDGYVEFREDHTQPPFRKTYLVREHVDNNTELADSEEFEDEEETEGIGIQVAGSYFYRSGLQATNVLTKLFNKKKLFNNPKDHEVLARLINYCTVNDKSALVLDFFGGSGTTFHAVAELNITDSGNRKCILIQLPEQVEEKTAAYKAGYKRISDITIERCKRVVEKLAKPQPQPAADESQTAIAFDKPVTDDAVNPAPVAPVSAGFQVFKLQKSNFPRTEWAPNPDLSEDENIAGFRKYIAEKEAQLVTAFNRSDLLTEILLKRGYPLTYTTETVDIGTQNEIIRASSGSSQVGTKTTLICLDAPILPETVEYFKTHTTEKLICLERALDTTAKWNLKHYLGDNFFAF